MFLSAVRSRSKPACSATASKSPFVSLSHPRSLALVTVCPTRCWAMPRGVLWSKRMRISHACRADRNRRGVKAAGRKFQHGLNLLPRHVVLFHDLLDARTVFEVFKNRGNRHTGVTKPPC